jgi:glycosyltransferase involved in cell wall biosynthesis
MKDVAGDTALRFPASDTAALTAAMERFANSPADRAAFAEKARRRASAYTWRRTASLTLDALEAAQ